MQYQLFAYIAAQENGPGSFYTTHQAEHIARNEVESLCSYYGPQAYPWNPSVALLRTFWTQTYSGGISPDDPRLQGPVKPIGNCNTDPSCQ